MYVNTQSLTNIHAILQEEKKQRVLNAFCDSKKEEGKLMVYMNQTTIHSVGRMALHFP